VYGFATLRTGGGRTGADGTSAGGPAELAVLCDARVTALAELVPPEAAPGPAAGFLDLLPHWDAWCDAVERALAGAPVESRAEADVEFLPPLVAPNVYCAGANYVDHIEEMTGVRPTPGEGSPYHFVVPAGTLGAHGQAVRTPSGCTQLDWEIELAVVIGRRAENVRVADALAYVAGYTVADDVSMRDFAMRPDTPFGVDWLRSKGYAGCLPVGPAVVPARAVGDPQHLPMRLWVNDELMQDSNTQEMLFGVAEQIEFLSAVVPLLPGDVISTGTPAGVGFARGRFLCPGDVVVAEIGSVGRLVHPVD
jgi:2-keto-4-pentenoate hydratase/2-oxohepta-3-ene-1,7-dioic acid hydratase in catechol pathway